MARLVNKQSCLTACTRSPRDTLAVKMAAAWLMEEMSENAVFFNILGERFKVASNFQNFAKVMEMLVEVVAVAESAASSAFPRVRKVVLSILSATTYHISRPD